MSIVQRLCLILLILAGLSAPSDLKAEPSLVFDASTGEVLFESHAGDPWYPASLTKLMTTYLTFRAIKAGRLKFDQKIVMSKRAAKEPPSKFGAKPGTHITVDFAIRYLLVRSGNDIAVALAEAVGGSVGNFVNQMNLAARRIGMNGTQFRNPHGLHHPEQVTTARDMGLLGATLYHEFPQYAGYYSLRHVKVGKHKLKNRNGLLRIMQGAEGMKTGFVCPSGFNLVASAKRGGRRLIAVVMGRKSGGSRSLYTKVLMEAAYNGGFRHGVFGKKRLASIRNVGGKAPNMRQRICNSSSVRFAKAKELDGWGVSFGRYRGAFNAAAVMDGQLNVVRSLVSPGNSGVMRVPFEKDHIALAWSLNQGKAKRVCSTLKQLNAHCEVVAPAAFSELSRRSVEYQALLAKKRANRKAAKKKRRVKKKKRKRRQRRSATR